MEVGKTSDIRESEKQEKQDDSSISGESTPPAYKDTSEDNPAAAQLMGVAMLEAGVIFHSLIIGLTLAVTGRDEFNVLLIVIVGKDLLVFLRGN